MRRITRRHAIRLIAATSALTLKAQQAPVGEKAASSDPSPVEHEIHAGTLSIGLTAAGHIVKLALGDKATLVPFHACTVLSGCTTLKILSSKRIPQNGIEVVQLYKRDNSEDRCTVTERFFPTGTSVRWEMEVLGQGAPWTTPIETQLAWLDAREALFWTAWDAPTPATTRERSLIPEANPREPREPWIDPLVARPFVDRVFRYGGVGAEGDAFSVPLATILSPGRDFGVTLAQSPEDALLDMSLSTTVFGDVILLRSNHRIAAGKPIRFAMDLVAHPADWRPALGWMTQRYPGFFESPNAMARTLDGCGAYSGYDSPLDADALKRWGFSVNWNAHFDFPFLGMSIPPVSKGTEWKSWYQTPTSLDKMERYDASMKQQGFHVLEYFVVTECGNYIQDSAPPQREPTPSEFWRDGNDFVHRVIPSAVLRDNDGKIHFSNWFKNVVVDPADPAWQKCLLEQIHTLVRELPDSTGICIDRMDWLRLYNQHADDGSSWIDGKPARFLANSWKETVGKISDVLHPAGKVMYGNTLLRRLDIVNRLDGFYDEYGDHPRMLNLTAFMAVHKPAIGWTRDINTLRPDPDALFQRHLHLGIFPTVPFPHADHTIAPDPWIEQYYSDYGPLLNVIKGKRWILEPHVIQCDEPQACVNLFEVMDGFAIPVTFSSRAKVTVSIRLPDSVSAVTHEARLLQPGGAATHLEDVTHENGRWIITVPIHRRCALIHIMCASPKFHRLGFQRFPAC